MFIDFFKTKICTKYILWNLSNNFCHYLELKIKFQKV